MNTKPAKDKYVRVGEREALALCRGKLTEIFNFPVTEKQTVAAGLGALLQKLDGEMLPRDVVAADVLEQFIRDAHKRGELEQDFAILVDVGGEPGIQVAHGDKAREFEANPPDFVNVRHTLN